MNLREIYSQDKNLPIISYEVFPPKNDIDGAKLEALFAELEKLMVFNPALISVTYGAGGSNQNESLEIIKRIKNDLKATPMPHFTCVSTDIKKISGYLKTLESLEVENILALRGDMPEDNKICTDFKYASELVEYIKKENHLSIAVAGDPEGHKECATIEEDIKNLKNKVEKGADVIYTQLFFNNDKFFEFCEKCQQIGINTSIIPGILPVTSYKTLDKMTSLCRVDVPKKFKEDLEKHKEDKDYIKKCGIDFATQQCIELLQNGVKGLHFYTLNNAYAASEILSNILVSK